MHIGRRTTRPFLKLDIVRISWYLRSFSFSKNSETNLNPLNIQLLGKSLSAKVFPSKETKTNNSGSLNLNRLQMQTLTLSRKHLENHSIPWQKQRQILPDVPGNLVPKLLGNSGTLIEHFQRMAADLGDSYFELAIEFSKQISANKKLIPPDKLSMDLLNSEASGWFRWKFSEETKKWNWEVAPEGPTDKVIVFDIETCPLISHFPLLACAYGPSGWYVWISDDKNKNLQIKDTEKLIPLHHPILIIGHHVAFDRARIREEYNLERNERRFLDTLSMHCAVAGLSSQQRGLWQERKKKKFLESEEIDNFDTKMTTKNDIKCDNYTESDQEMEQLTEKWGSKSSLNNLADAFQLHCDRKLDKSVRDDILLKAKSYSEIVSVRSEILAYCARDVEATAELFSVILPKFLKKSPHAVTFTALLEMGTFVLPVVPEEWAQYIKECDRLHKEATESIELELQALAEETMTNGLKDIKKTLNDPWLKQLDWTVEPKRYTKARYLKDGVTFTKDGAPRLIGNSTMSSRPAWFRKLIKNGKIHVTPRTTIVPFLLKLKWNGHVVQLIPDSGWCFERNPGIETKKSQEIHLNKRVYLRIPHPSGKDDNVGCLLTKNFLKFFQSGDLSTENSLIERVLEVNSRFSFWTGYRERIREQFLVVTGDNQSLILPTVQPMGTVTRRAVEKTWLTASNAKECIIGSELKAMVKAPSGWCFVGADVDSQELWIGSLLGDAQFGWSGSTALGWMTLQGTKSDSTDLHSRTANILGMTRDNAKIFNYGRIYGAGVKYATQLLSKFNPSLSVTDASARASELYHETKGRRISNKCDSFVSYVGGTESYMFNQMEAIARDPITKTPVLSAEISDALMTENVDDNFITSRVNWVVQSSGVDYLHMLLVAMAFLFKNYKISGRAALTIHDEVRFIVPETEKYRAALALQIANLWTRAAFVQAAGVQDLPLSVAFFSAVDIDSVLRKEVHMSCITPSNPCSIPPGQALDIYKLLQKCSSLGELSKNSSTQKDNFMYKFYANIENESPPKAHQILNSENEQKYLKILKKQMELEDNSMHSSSVNGSTKSKIKLSSPSIQSNEATISNEVKNIWKNLHKKVALKNKEG